MIIGLTGNIASGKSTVAKYLEQLGAMVIDTDLLARQVVEPSTPALRELVNSFGPGILHTDGTLNRKMLGEIIFKDPVAKKRLEEIVHPAIEKELAINIETFRNTLPNGILVLQIPLLIEVGWQHKVDQVWMVTVDQEIQLDRLMSRDKLTMVQAQERVNSQMPQSKKARYAQVLIDNSGSPKNTRLRVLEAWQHLTQKTVHE